MVRIRLARMIDSANVEICEVNEVSIVGLQAEDLVRKTISERNFIGLKNEI